MNIDKLIEVTSKAALIFAIAAFWITMIAISGGFVFCLLKWLL